MKKIAIDIDCKQTSETIQNAVFKAGGQWSDNTVKIKYTNERYLFISENLIMTASSDINTLNARIKYLIPVIEALIILDSLIEKQPFLNRSGIKVNFPLKIDSFVKDQYFTLCSHYGIDITKRIENLIAADIKGRIYNRDIIEDIKNILLQ